jgi:glycosyltransferase involved in cell wall biosynthesis
MQRPIHVWAPGIRDDTGGIQAFSRFLALALREAFPSRPLHVLVKNEVPDANDVLLRDAGVEMSSTSSFHPALRTPALAVSGVFRSVVGRPACSISTHMNFLPALHAAWCVTGAPFTAVLHGIEAWADLPALRRHALGEADHLFAVSRHTRDRVILKHGVESARVKVLHNTFDEARYLPGPKPAHLLEKHRLRADQPVILTVSRLSASERYKGHDQVLRALPAVAAVFPDVRYVIAGDGNYQAELMKLASQLGLSNHVIFTGYISRTELPDYYRLCDLFAMPSVKEGFGIVFLEAMACGKPVIAGNVDGSMDALADGELGVLVNPSAIEEITGSILDVLHRRHPNRLIFDPEKLREAVCARFGWRAFVENVSKHISPILDDG